MLHRKYQRWLGAALCVWQMQAIANVDGQHTAVSPATKENVVQQPAVPKKTTSTKLEKLADKAAIKYGINPYLFRALITHESNWNARAVSPRNAIGLAQIQPATAGEICGLEEEELFNVEKNLDCGAQYFSELLEQFGTAELALCAYNAGPNRVKRNGGKCPADYSVTQEYIQTVTETWRETLWSNVWVLDKWGYHLEDMFDFS
jgi:soluble lytic murein transglycosylase-like protein